MLINNLEELLANTKSVPLESFTFNVSDGIKEASTRAKAEVRGCKFPMHVSSLTDPCYRKIQLLVQESTANGKSFEETVGLQYRYMWAMGKAIELENKKWTFDYFGKGAVYGDWSCICGKTGFTGMGNNFHGMKCNHCGESVIHTHNEPILRFEDLITGSPDLLIMLKDPYDKQTKLTVIEFKSINKNEYKKLTGPKIDHKLQALFYLKLMETNKAKFDGAGIDLNLTSFRVVYTLRDFEFFGASCNKEFLVNLEEEPEYVLNAFDDCIAELRKIKANVEITDKVCESKEKGEKDGCLVVRRCFE